MGAFRFDAIDDAGRSHTGVVEADSARAARQQLRDRQWVPMAVTPLEATAAGAAPGRRRRRVFSRAGLAIWTRQLAGLVSAGLPLERALSSLADEAEPTRQRELVAQLRSEVNAGHTFARALSVGAADFDEVYRAVVAAGEQSGALAQVLERLADDLEQRHALRARLLAAALYPAIVAAVALLIVIFLLSFVVPQVAGVFTASRQALPALTLAMLGVSRFVREFGVPIGLALAAAAVAFGWMRRSAAFAERSDAALLRLPLAGQLARGYNAARFAATLAMLAGAGVPILKALQAAAETLGNRALRADALDALVQVREGAPLAAALAAHKRLPGLLAMFARLGEQTGQLPPMLARAAQQLSAEVQRRALALATVLEPLLIVGMGAVVMLIVLAVLLPIIQINTWVR